MKRPYLIAAALVALLVWSAVGTRWYGDPPGQLECAAIAHTIVTGCRGVPASGGK